MSKLPYIHDNFKTSPTGMRDPRRQRAYELTSGNCFYCSHALAVDDDLMPDGLSGGFIEPPGKRFLEIDHVLPRSRGGRDTPENLVPTCGFCNAQKGNKTAEEYRAWLTAKAGATVSFFSERLVSVSALARHAKGAGPR